MKEALNEGVNVDHQSLTFVWNELVNTRYGMRSDLGTRMLEKLQKLRNHEVERPVQSIRVQDVIGILADFLKSSKCSFADMEVFRVQEKTELGKQVLPVCQLAFRSNGRDKDSNRGSNERRSVSNGTETLILDELSNFRRKLV